MNKAIYKWFVDENSKLHISCKYLKSQENKKKYVTFPLSSMVTLPKKLSKIISHF